MRKTSATRATKAAPVKTILELAKLVDRDKGTISRWLQRDDWPFAKRPPFARSTIPKILRWVADTLIERESSESEAGKDGDPNDTKALRKEKLRKEFRKLNAQADAAETALARERGKLLDASEVETEWAKQGNIIRNGFQNLPSQIVPLALSHGMPHETASVFQQQVEAAVAGILRHLSRDGPEDNERSPAEASAGAVPAGTVDPE